MILKRYTYSMVKLSFGLSRTLLVICQLYIVAACTKAVIHHPEPGTGEGTVRIYPDMSVHSLPASQYHFYNTNTDLKYIVCPCDGSGNFDGILPVGTYRVIATNTSALNVDFRGMDSYETASVYALPLMSRSFATAIEQPTFYDQQSTYSYLTQPDDVYSTIVEELVVTENNPAHSEPLPTLLTKHLTLVFSMQDGLDVEVVSMTGVLPGIYPAVHLYTRQGLQIEKSPDMAVNFETIADGNKRVAEIFLFGIYDPVYGENYTNNLELNLTMGGESTITIVDLTEILSDMIRKNEGTIPLELSLSIELTKTPIGVGVEVEGWIQEGEDEQETDT